MVEKEKQEKQEKQEKRNLEGNVERVKHRGDEAKLLRLTSKFA